MSDNERLKQEFVTGAKDIKAAAKEAAGKLTGNDELVEEGRDEQRRTGVPHDGDHPGPSHGRQGGASVSGEKSGREW